MTDETADKAEQMAQMIATAVRLSHVLGITLDDAVSLVVKFAAAMATVEKVRSKAS